MTVVLQEQLRPQSWDELYGFTEKDKLRKLVMQNLATSIILAGPAGTGKTSAALLLAKEYYGGDNVLMDKYFKRTNASDERGIEAIRNWKDLVDRRVGAYRFILLLDEGDGMTPAAKFAFKAFCEQYSHNLLTIWCVNNLGKIDDPILSRSAVFYFNPIPYDISLDWFKITCKKMNIEYDAAVPQKVLRYYKGDLRRIVSDFIARYMGEKVMEWNPRPTYAQEIITAKDPFEKYIELRQKVYISPTDLLEELFVLNKYKNPDKFSLANDRINNGGDEMSNIALAMTGLVKC